MALHLYGSKTFYLTQAQLLDITTGKPDITYVLQDVEGNPEYTWDGNQFVLTDKSRWTDIDFPIIIRTTGPNVPTLVALQGNITAPQWPVNSYAVCEGQELVHSWVEGSDLHWHCHVITNGVDTTDRYLKWEIEWCWADVGGVLSNVITTTSPDIVIPANTPSKTHILCSIGTHVLQAKIAGHIYARLRRVASLTGTAPTNNPWCTMLQIHIKNDYLGSKNIGTK